MKNNLLFTWGAFCLWLALPFAALAQPAERLIKVNVVPNHSNWLYRPGEKAEFAVTVLQNGNPVKGAKIHYQMGPEKFENQKDSLVLPDGTTRLAGGTLTNPGFLRCAVVVRLNGREYRGLATAAFDPEKIAPTVDLPPDFASFWAQAKADLAKVPLDTKMTLLPDRCTEKVNVYHVNLQNYRQGGAARLYGILCVPKVEGKYPALLRVPGAGIRPYAGDVRTAEQGVITLEIGIHGLPVVLDPGVYNDLGAGWLNQYWTYNLDHRDHYYYKRVYLGCVRANDLLTSLPQYNGQQLAVAGGSQGGALALVTAALDPRVKYLAALYPALADLTGYLKGRAGGWPHLFHPDNAHHRTEAKMKTAAYYDVVNFARQVKVPVFYGLGFNDEVCPPTSMYAAYNVLTSPKTLKVYPETGHWTYPEQTDEMTQWLLEKLRGQ
ncbi:MAG: acetylxylan esterase [Bernardetiaceae bacterium]|jgi:cephalosporin-C deacetylase-like acetyl esterase|nr:acetylxylan esterase [Bernardetiaceae bacterium]